MLVTFPASELLLALLPFFELVHSCQLILVIGVTMISYIGQVAKQVCVAGRVTDW